jgi:hypothetical protein
LAEPRPGLGRHIRPKRRSSANSGSCVCRRPRSRAPSNRAPNANADSCARRRRRPQRPVRRRLLARLPERRDDHRGVRRSVARLDLRRNARPFAPLTARRRLRSSVIHGRLRRRRSGPRQRASQQNLDPFRRNRQASLPDSDAKIEVPALSVVKAWSRLDFPGIRPQHGIARALKNMSVFVKRTILLRAVQETSNGDGRR